MHPVAPPSSDYVPGPEHPPSLDYVPGPEHPPFPDYVPGPEHPPLPVYVLEPEYSEYLMSLITGYASNRIPATIDDVARMFDVSLNTIQELDGFVMQF
nr:hypothetical protein [Tanacetum cinerariifolium]